MPGNTSTAKVHVNKSMSLLKFVAHSAALKEASLIPNKQSLIGPITLEQSYS